MWKWKQDDNEVKFNSLWFIVLLWLSTWIFSPLVRWSTCLWPTPSTREPSTRRSSHPSPSRWDWRLLWSDDPVRYQQLYRLNILSSNRKTWTWLWTLRRPSAATWWTSELRTWRRAGSTWSWVCCGRSSRLDFLQTSSSARTKVSECLEQNNNTG